MTPPGRARLEPMSLDKLDIVLAADLAALDREGRSKSPERVIVGYLPL